MIRQVLRLIAGALAVAGCSPRVAPSAFSGLREVNPPTAANSARVTVITGVRLIDGRGGPPIDNAVVVVAAIRSSLRARPQRRRCPRHMSGSTAPAVVLCLG